mmetsp:Transcript_17258/g.28356  ORF Transcript_17258/g.28356 Transcript_17258/m.28356 type:complete len:546 (+) Transcript_17258:84-1721(+)
MAEGGPPSPPAPHEREQDLYAVLNVPRDATEEQLRSAYRRLSLNFHPDRHTDEEKKKHAAEAFQRLHFAYETLTDSQKRLLYDQFGVEGLKTGLELGPYLNVEEFLKQKFQRDQKQADRKLEGRLTQHASVNVNVNASETINPYAERQYPEISSMSLGVNVSAPLGKKDSLTFGAQVAQNNTSGSGNLSATVRRQHSAHMHSEIVSQFGRHPSLDYRISRNLSGHSVGQMIFTFGHGIGLTLVGSRQLTTHTWGTMTYTVGPQSALLLSVNRRGKHATVAASLRLGYASLGFASSISRHISELSHWKVALRLGLRGFEIELGGGRRISANTSVSCALVAGFSGVTLRLRLHRGGTKFVVPILLSATLAPVVVVGGMVVPSAVAAIVKLLVLKPVKQRKEKRKLDETRKKGREQMAAAKAEAEGALSLLKEIVARKRQQEEAVRGLVITKAQYGNLQPKEEDTIEAEFPPSVDVTVAVQHLVDNSQLHLYDASKASLIGFYDPCPGERKQLLIEYMFKAKMHRVVVDDLEAVAIPLKEHLLQNGAI